MVHKQDAIQTVMIRNNFYRDGYRAMLKVAIVQGIVIIFLIAIIVGLILASNVKHVFFATNVDGRIMPIEPVNEPYFQDEQVVTWVAQAAREVMQMDYLNYKSNISKAYNKFTLSGRVDFDKALKDSRLLEAIDRNKLVSQLKPEGAPQILRKTLTKEGVYSWFLRMPISIIYDGTEPPQPFRGMLQVRVDRVNFLENPEGIAFGQWVVGEGKK
jgi:intracellular multiplication protein IcmL